MHSGLDAAARGSRRGAWRSRVTVSIQRSSQAEQVASNAWLRANGGFIFAGVPNAGILAVATVRQISMRRNTTLPRATPSSRASSRASGGFTTIGSRTSLPAPRFPPPTRIRWINRRRDRPVRCRQTGRRCFTNRARAAQNGFADERSVLRRAFDRHPAADLDACVGARNVDEAGPEGAARLGKLLGIRGRFRLWGLRR